VVERRVRFTVQNLDRTDLGATERESCPANPDEYGARWTIEGRLVGPTSMWLAPRGDRAVTLYVHGLAENGRTSFLFDAIPGYNYAREQARAGHASVVIDRVGYGRSTIPDGRDLCTGAEADMVHQVVSHLRAGDYGGPRFASVALAGWSAGGLLAEIEAATFQDVDALAMFAYEDQGFTAVLGQELGRHAARCAANGGAGEPKFAGSLRPGPFGYGWTFDDRDDPLAPADHTRLLLSPGADPAVVEAALASHERDPCGENPGPYIATNPARLGQVTVPLLLVYGEQDPLFDASQAPVQASHYGSTDKTVVVLPHTAHLFMLEPTAPMFRAAVASWLSARGF
jgi:pimeloyl-ACP methyl ester carboxylesterase